jgi:hypothetical protein
MDTLIGWAKSVLDNFIVNPDGGGAIWVGAIVLALAFRYARSIFVGLVRALLGR